MKEADTIVIGSGLAGLSAAWEIAKRGRKVLVLEAEDVIGGRTSSWTEKDGMKMESGLHKWLGIYRALPRLMKEVGVEPDDILTWVDAMELHNDEGKSAKLVSAPFHRPLQTVASYLGNNHYLPFSDKLKLALMGASGIIRCLTDPRRLDQVTIASYAATFGVSKRTIHDTLHALTTGVFFLPADTYTAYASHSPVVEGLKRGMTFRVGAFNGGMTDVMMRPIADAIERKGGAIVTGQRVEKLLLEGNVMRGVKTASGKHLADNVILATSLHPAQELIRDVLPDHPWFRDMLTLETLSAVTFQAELDAPFCPTDHTHFSTTQVSCFAEQSHTTFRGVPGRISAILYPPSKFLAMNDEEIKAAVEDAMDALKLPVRGHVTRFRVVKHPYDFYAMIPGSEALRPLQATPVKGFALAGDYTKQPFLASMEGAVISGRKAADSLR